MKVEIQTDNRRVSDCIIYVCQINFFVRQIASLVSVHLSVITQSVRINYNLLACCCSDTVITLNNTVMTMERILYASKCN